VRAAAALARIVVQTAADAVGMEPRELRQSAEPGQALSDVITANGGDPAQVAADAKAKALEDIDTALNEGKITAEQAENMRANLDDAIARIMSHPLRERRVRPRAELNRDLVQTVAESTGLSVRDILGQLRQGKSLATVITENGGDVEAVKTQIIAEETAAINEAVTNGRLTQERADELISNLPTLVDRRLNFERVSL
jgi:hypothetical protein